MRQPFVLILLVFLSAVPVRADEPRPEGPDDTVQRTAAAILRAVAEGDAGSLAQLASSEEPDPWIVADEIVAQGQHDAALAFANAAPRPTTLRLPAYLEAQRLLANDGAARKEQAAVRSAIDKSLRARAAGQHTPALEAAGPWIEGRDDVPGATLALVRAYILDELGRTDDAIEAFDRAARRGLAIGWDTMASEMLYQAGRRLHGRAFLEPALARFREHLEIERRLESPMGIGRAHFRVSAALHALARMDEAHRHREESRRLATESADAFYAAKVLLDDAVDKARHNDPEGAIDLFLEGASQLEALTSDGYPPRFRPEPRQVTQALVGALTNACSMAARLGRSRDAKKYGRRAVAAAKTSPDTRVLDRARALVARIEAAELSADGRSVQALGPLERARGLYEQLGYRDELADVLRRIGDIRMSLADLPTALACYEEAIRILTDAGAVRKLIPAHWGAGDACARLGRPSDAKPHYEEAARLARMLGEPQPLADALNMLARFHRMQSQYGEAHELLIEALLVHRKHPGQTDVTPTWAELARYLGAVGDHDGALAYADKIVEARKDSPHANPLAGARELRADMLHNHGRTAEALAELDRVLAMRRGGGNRAELADTLMTIGRLRLDRFDEGDADAAVEVFEEVIGLYVASKDEAAEITARVNLGRTYAWLRDHEGALEELSYALERTREIQDIVLEATTLAALAEAHFVNKTYDDAMRAAYRGTELVGSYALDQGEGERDVARGRFEPLTRWGAAAAVQLGHVVALYEFLERGRATALVTTLGGRDAIREAQVPRALRVAEDEARAASAMAYATYSAARRDEVPRSELRALREALEAAREKQRFAVAAIQRAVYSQADLVYSAPTGPDIVQASLAPDEALVLFGSNGWSYVAFILMRTDAKILKLGALETVDAAVEALVANPGDAGALAEVQKLVIDPVRKSADQPRWQVSPHGLLAYVPFGLAAPEREVCLVPSATTLQVLRQAKTERGTKVLAVGDPEYALAGSRTTTAAERPGSSVRGTALVPLPGTRLEARSVGDVLLLGADATETRLREAMKTEHRWRAIHLACHGLLDDVAATQSALALVGDDQNDGFLEANEVATDVRMAADLVVLSGCETGRGRIRAGEGLQGLSRAFMLAGTPRVLASLWKVDDDATRALMVKFYELWNPKDASKGLRAPAALRKAQEYVRSQKQWTDPRYWAAWVLWGLPD